MRNTKKPTLKSRSPDKEKVNRRSVDLRKQAPSKKNNEEYESDYDSNYEDFDEERDARESRSRRITGRDASFGNARGSGKSRIGSRNQRDQDEYAKDTNAEFDADLSEAFNSKSKERNQSGRKKTASLNSRKPTKVSSGTNKKSKKTKKNMRKIARKTIKTTAKKATASGISRRGFASMSAKAQRAIASMGGKAAHKQGVAHEWTSREARAAGRKGGVASGKSRSVKNKRVKVK
jgi:uncharacterized protein